MNYSVELQVITFSYQFTTNCFQTKILKDCNIYEYAQFSVNCLKQNEL